jgi:hypothetical protein
LNEDGAAPAPLPRWVTWAAEIPDAEWQVYQGVMAAARAAGIRFALGGAFAAAVYSGHWRNTNDLDFYVLPEDAERMRAVVERAGLRDLYEQEPYDRRWIFRATQVGVIVDVIWAMANQRSQVDEAWLTRGPEVDLRGERLRVIPAEEVIWAKLYVFHRDRCDWPDVLNILYHYADRLDWRHLLVRLADDARLLAGVLSLYAWLSPGRARHVPAWVWAALHLAPPAANASDEGQLERAGLFDSRPWYFVDAGESADP